MLSFNNWENPQYFSYLEHKKLIPARELVVLQKALIQIQMIEDFYGYNNKYGYNHIHIYVGARWCL